jgi:hypothetical protein
VESGRLGSDFRPLPAAGVALSVPDQCRVRDRSTIMARHLYADLGDAFADAQVHVRAWQSRSRSLLDPECISKGVICIASAHDLGCVVSATCGLGLQHNGKGCISAVGNRHSCMSGANSCPT